MNRQTLLLSLLALVLIGALWWMFLFSPGREELARLDNDIAAAENETVTLGARIAQLEGIRSTAPETEALIAQLGSIVPTDPALAGAIRQIEAAALDAGVRVESLSTSRPSEMTEVAESAPGLHRMAVRMTLTGSYFQLVDFMRRLEDPTVTARGITFVNLSLSASEYPELSAAVTGSMFAILDPVPEAGAEAESVSGEAPIEGDEADVEPLQEEGGVE